MRLDALVSDRDFVPDASMLELAPQVVAEELELFQTSREELQTQELIAQRQKRQRDQELLGAHCKAGPARDGSVFSAE